MDSNHRSKSVKHITENTPYLIATTKGRRMSNSAEPEYFNHVFWQTDDDIKGEGRKREGGV
jgi:hypothetical protein